MEVDARLVLVGDPEQLASVEAGAVLGDIVGPVSRRLRMGAVARARLEAVTRQPVPATEAEGATSFAAFVLSDEGRSILAEYGFGSP